MTVTRTRLELRPIQADDAERLRRFHDLSALILKDNLRARELFTSTAERLALPYRMQRATGVVELRISLAPLRGPADPLLP